MAEARTYVLQVSGQPLAANRQRGLHWSAIARDRAVFRDAFTLLARQEHSGPPLERAHVMATLVRMQGQRPLDPDNAHSALKGCLDGLVAGDLLVDDSGDCLELVVRQEVGPERAVRLEVTEVLD